jgi:methylenetetrahydrofolate reductase (NADPH)
MSLREALASGTFAVTAELGPPLEPDPAPVRETARRFAPIVHAANVTDNQAATVKLSPLACSVWMLEEGLDPIMQVTTRDRNLLALQADLLGAWALGVRAILALTGDPLKVGPYESLTTPVGDVDSTGLIALVARMNAGMLAAGETLASPPDFLIATAANPLVDTPARLEAKLDAGAHLFQSNIIYDVDRFAEWYAGIVDAGIAERAPMLVGVTPPRSTRMLRYMHERIPGVEVDDATFARMEGLEGEAAKRAGIEIAVDVVARLRVLPHVGGVHLMAPGWEAEAVPAVLAGTDLAVGSSSPEQQTMGKAADRDDPVRATRATQS